MPSVDDISWQVFTGDGVVPHSDATYYIAGEGSANWDWYRTGDQLLRRTPQTRGRNELRPAANNRIEHLSDLQIVLDHSGRDCGTTGAISAPGYEIKRLCACLECLTKPELSTPWTLVARDLLQ